jgi:hypothetical protein
LAFSWYEASCDICQGGNVKPKIEGNGTQLEADAYAMVVQVRCDDLDVGTCCSIRLNPPEVPLRSSRKIHTPRRKEKWEIRETTNTRALGRSGFFPDGAS